MKQQLCDYDVEAKEIPIFYDNTSAIAITHKLVLHSRTKHIDVRYHFIRDYIEKKNVRIEYVRTEKQITNIFTKSLSEARFMELRNELGMIEMEP